MAECQTVSTGFVLGCSSGLHRGGPLGFPQLVSQGVKLARLLELVGKRPPVPPGPPFFQNGAKGFAELLLFKA